MLTRLKVTWWALLGRPIIYKVDISGEDWVITYRKSHGPLLAIGVALGEPSEPMYGYGEPVISFTTR